MDELELAMLGELPREQVEKIISELPERKREQLAENPNLDLCGEVCFDILVNDEESIVIGALASNKAIKNYPDIVRKLSKKEGTIREILAQNPAIGDYPDIVKQLSNDPYLEVISYLAYNPALKNYPDIIEELATFPDEWVKSNLAQNPAIVKYPDIVNELINNKETESSILNNWKVIKEYPDLIIEKIEETPELLWNRPYLMGEFLRYNNPRYDEVICNNPNIRDYPDYVKICKSRGVDVKTLAESLWD